jgi:predicted nucleic acid-binding protein
VARGVVEELLVWRPITVDESVITAAWRVMDLAGIGWWDSLIVGAAQVLGCRYLLTEDLQHGQRIGTVEVVNPFLTTPAALGV